ncbi:MAG: hypothetical protein P4L57_01840 [Rhizomicrobium sp.]|nr:hypothetical protein [Rhizomicrobium sp.]
MPKDSEPVAGLEVTQVYPQQVAPMQAVPQGGTPVSNGNGLLMVPGGANPIFVVPQAAPQPVASQPSVVVLMVSAKDEKKEEKKEVSSVFQRL